MHCVRGFSLPPLTHSLPPRSHTHIYIHPYIYLNPSLCVQRARHLALAMVCHLHPPHRDPAVACDESGPSEVETNQGERTQHHHTHI